MPDEHSANSDSAGRSPFAFDDFGDYARFQAASYASFAEALERSQRQLSAVFNSLPSIRAEEAVTAGPSAHGLLSGFDEGAQRARLLGLVNAAQAVAWDHMQAHGGPEDPEAYADYGEATEFHRDLLTSTPPAMDSVEGNTLM